MISLIKNILGIAKVYIIYDLFFATAIFVL